MVKNKVSKNDNLYIVSYVIRCVKNSCELKKSKKLKILDIMTEKGSEWAICQCSPEFEGFGPKSSKLVTFSIF